MADTPNLVLPYIQAAQAQKHVTHNEAIRLLDGMVQLAVVSRVLTAPPGSPTDGDRYIVASGATGLWTGWDLNVAFWIDGAWVRLIPRPGWVAYSVADADFYSWTGAAWATFGGGGGGGSTFTDVAFTLTDDADVTKIAKFELSGIGTGTTRTFTLPNTTSTLAVLAATQTFTGTTTFSGTFTVSAATASLGTSTATSTANVGTGATLTATTKTVNLGTGGVSGSTTVVNIGSAVAGALGTTVINSPTVTFASSVSAVAMAAANLSALYVGIGGATADATNRLSINTPAVLFNNAGASITATLNKNAAGNDAGFIFQTGFSTRALFGINGSDDYSLKVSPNGSTFFDAYTVARATGRITVANGLVLNPTAGDLASPVDGALWYNSTTAKFRAQQNGLILDVLRYPLAVYGDGSDGTVTISSGTTTLTRDMFYANLTISGTGILNTAGFKVYVSGTLDISAAAAGSIINNGGNGGAGATAGTVGAVGAAPGLGTTLANGTQNAAGAGGVAAGTAAASAGAVAGVIGGGHGVAGAGGLGASGAGGAGGPASSVTAIGASFRRYLPELFRISAGAIGLWSTSRVMGGGGGGGDATAGGGGGGCGGQGGAVVIFARFIARGTNVAVGIIRSLGGNGGNGGSATAGNRGGGGGGSGGPGGFVYLCFNQLTGSTITNAIDVTGGNGGTGGNGFGTGIGGGGGGSGGGGRVVLVELDAGTGSELAPTNGAAGTTTATITGGAGATATVARVSL